MLVVGGFRGEAISLRAAALTYLTLFALVPLLAVLYSVIDLFTGEAQLHDRVQSYVNSQLGIGAGAAIAGALTAFTSKATVKTLGAIGFALLFVSVISLLWNIESAFNHIYAVRKPRSPVQRLLKYWTFLTLGPIFLSLSVYVSWTISRMQDTHGPHSHPNHSEVLHVLAALSSVAITYASLAFLYKVIPNARVRVRSALLAALIAGSAWEDAGCGLEGRLEQRRGLAILVQGLCRVRVEQGLAQVAIPLRARALHGGRLVAEEALDHRQHLHLRLVLPHALEGTDQPVERGAPVRVQAVVRELGVTGRLAREGLAALAKAGLAVEAKHGGWLLSREPSRITLAEVRAAARATLRFPAQQADDITAAVQSCLARADGMAQAALGESLESFLRRFQALPVESATPAPDPRPLGVGQSARKPA